MLVREGFDKERERDGALWLEHFRDRERVRERENMEDGKGYLEIAECKDTIAQLCEGPEALNLTGQTRRSECLGSFYVV